MKAGIQLNERVSLRARANAISQSAPDIVAPYPDLAQRSRRAIIFRSAALFFVQTADLKIAMPRRLQIYFWRSLDHAMPDGPPYFLFSVVVVLLIVNGVIAFLRW
jgi:hypothetical protein